MPSQQSKTTTLKLLNRLHQMTSASSLLPLFALFPPFGLRCLTTMKQCLAGRIRQERERQRQNREEGRERETKKKDKDSESETGIKRSERLRGKQRLCKRRGGGASCACIRGEKCKIKGSTCWGGKKKVLSEKFFFLAGTLGRDRRLNFGAVLSNSCRQQRKVQKKKRSC